jgi:CheY-like chemotaxis protein
VVDDDEAVRAAAARRLTRAGYDVVAAPGAAVLEAVTGRRVDVVLSDLPLRDVAGARLSAAGRAAAPGVPVVFMSGAAPADGARPGPVLAKPFSPEALLAAVGAALPPSAA